MTNIELTSQKNNFPHILSILSAGTVLGFYGYIGSFNRLMGDSLCSYYYAERLGLLRSIWFWRNLWSGRYSAYGFDWLLTNLLAPQNAPLFIPFVLLFWLAINTWAIALILRSMSKKDILFPALSLGFISVYLTLATSPFIQQSFFWLDGFRAYTLPIILMSIYSILYFLFIDKINLRPATFLSFLLFFTSGGLSETFAVFQFTLLFFGIGYYWFIEHPVKADNKLALLIAGFIGTIVSILVIFTAPGNSVRQSFFPPPPNVLDLVSISLEGYGNFLHGLLSAPQKSLALLGGILAAAWIGASFNGVISSHGKRILLQITGAFLLSFSCFPPGVYGYNEPPPDRVLIIATFILTTMLMSAAFLVGNVAQQRTNTMQSAWRGLSILMVIFLIGSAWINVNILYNSRMEYIKYAQEWDRIDETIKAAKAEGQETITVQQTTFNWAGMDLLNNNRNHWVNECYSLFYGIQVFGERK